jgi:hypothetical protein
MACAEEDGSAGGSGFGCETSETVAAKHTLQITIALPTLTFSRSHQAVLFGFGSEGSDCFKSLGAADVWSVDNSLCATAHRAISFFFKWLADFGRVSRSDSRAIAKAGRWMDARESSPAVGLESSPAVGLEAQPPRFRPIIMISSDRRMILYHALMVNRSLLFGTDRKSKLLRPAKPEL